jgi:signal peptidase II
VLSFGRTAPTFPKGHVVEQCDWSRLGRDRARRRMFRLADRPRGTERGNSGLMVWLELILTATLVAATDQISKAVVLARWPLAALKPRAFVSIQCVLNRQGALATFAGAPVLAGLWAAMLLLAVLTLHYGLLGHGAVVPVAIGATVGGATGNVLDRLRRGAVVDFVAIGPWPVFNLADAALVAGTGLILLTTLYGHA